MNDIELFLAHAIQLERDAARRFEDLTEAMKMAGNGEVQALFSRLGALSRMHLKQAMKRAGYRDVPEMAPGEFQWPEGVTPEAAGWTGVDGSLDALAALALAQAGERSGHAYYLAIAEQTSDPEVRHMAQEFATEEAAHVRELDRWIQRMAS